MSRMIDALKHIDGRQVHAPIVGKPAPSEPAKQLEPPAQPAGIAVSADDFPLDARGSTLVAPRLGTLPSTSILSLLTSDTQFVEPSPAVIAPPEIIAPVQSGIPPDESAEMAIGDAVRFVDELISIDAVDFVDSTPVLDSPVFLDAVEYPAVPEDSKDLIVETAEHSPPGSVLSIGKTDGVGDPGDSKASPIAASRTDEVILESKPQISLVVADEPAARSAEVKKQVTGKTSSTVGASPNATTLRLADLDLAEDEPAVSPLTHLGEIQDLLDEATDDEPAALRSVPLERRPAKRPRPQVAAGGTAMLKQSLPAESAAYTAYRALADQIIEQTLSSDCPVLAFTVPERLDEGAFSIIVLAKVMAEMKIGEILLVDANPGRLFVSGQAGALGVPGFGDVLVGKSEWSQIILATDQARIALAPIGKTTFAPGHGPSSPRWDELRNRFRFVLVDTGPAGEPENIWLIPRCDAAYLIVGLGDTLREAAVQAMSQFNHSGTRVLGAIVANGEIAIGRRDSDSVDQEFGLLNADGDDLFDGRD